MTSYEQRGGSYTHMWNTVAINNKPVVTAAVNRIFSHEAAYKQIEEKTGVPWFMVGALHNRESSLRFDRHMHNGDPLSARTRQVPKGRPLAGSPPFTFMESAIDALKMPPHSLDRYRGKWTINRILYECERYNGFGYVKRGPSPYLWSYTNHYKGGKYVADGKYDAGAWDQQIGCAALFAVMFAMRPELKTVYTNVMETKVPTDVAEEAKKRAAPKADALRNASGAGAAGAGGGEAAGIQPVDSGFPVLGYLAVVLIVVCVVAGVVGMWKRASIKAVLEEKWGKGSAA